MPLAKRIVNAIKRRVVHVRQSLHSSTAGAPDPEAPEPVHAPGRDTDRDWEFIAQQNPFYGVLTNERYRGKSLDDDTRQEFYDTGRTDIAFVLDSFARHFDVLPPFTSAIDFGCGVGRLTNAIAEHCEHVVGVDISDTMLATARANTPWQNVQYQKGIPEHSVSWVNSHIVLQHIPPRRGMVILRSLLEKVEHGGVISIQVPFYKERNFLDAITERAQTVVYDGDVLIPLKQEKDPEGAMHMFDYPWPAILNALVDNGFEQYFLSHTNHGGAHGTWIFSRRTA